MNRQEELWGWADPRVHVAERKLQHGIGVQAKGREDVAVTDFLCAGHLYAAVALDVRHRCLETFDDMRDAAASCYRRASRPDLIEQFEATLADRRHAAAMEMR